LAVLGIGSLNQAPKVKLSCLRRTGVPINEKTHPRKEHSMLYLGLEIIYLVRTLCTTKNGCIFFKNKKKEDHGFFCSFDNTYRHVAKNLKCWKMNVVHDE